MRTDIRRPIAVVLDTVPALSTLEPLWRNLESRSNAAFFLSWSWIGCWLASLKPPLQAMLMTATRDNEVVGLGIFVAAPSKRLRLLPSRVLALHATGDAAYDMLTVEHNDLLVATACADEVRSAMFDGLFTKSPPWDQLLLPGLSQEARKFLIARPGVSLRELSNPCHLIDLKPLHGREDGYLNQLNSNTRQQIRRSMKAYRELGPLQLTAAPDVKTAQGFLDRLGALHQRHWLALGKPGAFGSPYFVDFHRQLISKSFERGEIQLLRISAGDADLGYLYNFVHDGRVLFYQSGFDYQLIEKHGRPGLVAHALAIEHNASLGHHTYDLLAGSARYKRSLASHSETLSWVVLHQNTPAFRLEELLRRCKHFLTKQEAVQPDAVDH